MSSRRIVRQIESHALSEGAGVTVHRSIGTPALRNLDPFLMLDYFSSDDPDDYIAGFPDHPHRGFITFTYMLDGHMQHRDSMGNEGDLRAGGAQWMKAASGVIHSEMPRQIDGLMRGFQLWINLPAQEKMSAPAYQEIPSGAIPEIELANGRVRLLSGQFQQQRGPVQDDITHLHYLDVYLAANVEFETTLAHQDTAFVYLFEGALQIEDRVIPAQRMLLLSEGEQLQLTASGEGARFLLVSGTPLHEPIVQHGPFVMNSRAEIEQAMRDYRDNRLVRESPLVTSPSA